MPKKGKPATPRRPAPKPLPEPLPPNPPPIPVRVTSTIPAHLYKVRPRKEIVVTFREMAHKAMMSSTLSARFTIHGPL